MTKVQFNVAVVNTGSNWAAVNQINQKEYLECHTPGTVTLIIRQMILKNCPPGICSFIENYLLSTLVLGWVLGILVMDKTRTTNPDFLEFAVG